MDEWIERSKDREKNILGKIIYFWFITGIFFPVIYLIINIVLIKYSSDLNIYINSEHIHPLSTCFISLQSGFACRLRKVNQIYFLLDRIIISMLISSKISLCFHGDSFPMLFLLVDSLQIIVSCL